MNPCDTDATTGRGSHAITSIRRGKVVAAPSANPDTGPHDVDVLPYSFTESITASVAVDALGDVMVPTKDDQVLIGYRANGEKTIIGYLYDGETSLPDLLPGERQVGHPASDTTVTFHDDGSLTITGENDNNIELANDGTVTINDGSTAPIVDVSTSKDADGHVTDVSVARASDVFVPTP